MSVSPRSGAMGLEGLIRFKYYIVQKWGNRITFEQNAAKNSHYIKKCSK